MKHLHHIHQRNIILLSSLPLSLSRSLYAADGKSVHMLCTANSQYSLHVIYIKLLCCLFSIFTVEKTWIFFLQHMRKRRTCMDDDDDDDKFEWNPAACKMIHQGKGKVAKKWKAFASHFILFLPSASRSNIKSIFACHDLRINALIRLASSFVVNVCVIKLRVLFPAIISFKRNFSSKRYLGSCVHRNQKTAKLSLRRPHF